MNVAAARTVRWGLLCACLGGCVAVPFATPPLQLAVGAGVYGEFGGSGPAVPIQVRAGLHPLGFVEELLSRRVDFGAGWLLDYSPLEQLVQGGYAEFSVVLLQTPFPEAVGRLSARVQGRFLHRVFTGQLGGGGALLLTWEYAYFTRGQFGSWGARAAAGGYRFGEGSIGAFLEASVHVLGPVAWSVSAGVLVRIPAIAGVAWAASL